MKTPKQLGFKMPAEWQLQEAIWMVWPKDAETFPLDCLQKVRESYALVILEVSRHQKVKILVDNKKEKKQVTKYLKQRKALTRNVIFLEIPTTDVWIRDFGPTFLVRHSGKKTYVKWIFNAWGEKYPELIADNNVFANEILGEEKIEKFEADIILEGGSIDVNGNKCVLTTRQCLLNKNRNFQLTKEQIEEKLKDFLGVEKILWLNEGIAGDDTDGHIDDIARFVSKDAICYAIEHDESDDNYKLLKENEELLKEMTNVNEKKFKLVPIEMPKPQFYNNRRLPASHLNFLITNAVVLVPVFGGESDDKAIKKLKKFFPERKVIGIPSREWTVGFGAVHCSTQQEPK